MCAVAIVVAAADAAERRLPFVESVTQLPDGSEEIVVSGQMTLQSSRGGVQSVNLRERLEQAAKSECKGGSYQLTPSDTVSNVPTKSGLKFTLKGLVRCTS